MYACSCNWGPCFIFLSVLRVLFSPVSICFSGPCLRCVSPLFLSIYMYCCSFCLWVRVGQGPPSGQSGLVAPPLPNTGQCCRAADPIGLRGGQSRVIKCGLTLQGLTQVNNMRRMHRLGALCTCAGQPNERQERSGVPEYLSCFPFSSLFLCNNRLIRVSSDLLFYHCDCCCTGWAGSPIGSPKHW